MGAIALINTQNIDHIEWLKARQLGIGGSDVSAILGLNKWKSAIDVWVDKTTAVAESEQSEAAYWGNVLENVVAQEFQKKSGLKVRRRNYILQHQDYPYMIANIDREIVGHRIGLECKTASEYRKDEWNDDEIPAEYILQCQHYMAVTGYEAWWISVLIGGNKFIYKRIDRDEDIIQMLIQQEGIFWNTYVVPKIMPPADSSDACKEALLRRYPYSNGQAIALDSTAEKLLKDRQALSQQAQQLEAQIALIDNTIKQQLGDNETAQSTSFKVTWKTVTAERFDSKTFKEDHPDLHGQYLKASSSRRFTVKEIK